MAMLRARSPHFLLLAVMYLLCLLILLSSYVLGLCWAHETPVDK